MQHKTQTIDWKVSKNKGCHLAWQNTVKCLAYNVSPATLALKIAAQFVCKAPWFVVVMLHHAKIGYKRFSSSEDIVSTNIN